MTRSVYVVQAGEYYFWTLMVPEGRGVYLSFTASHAVDTLFLSAEHFEQWAAGGVVTPDRELENSLGEEFVFSPRYPGQWFLVIANRGEVASTLRAHVLVRRNARWL